MARVTVEDCIKRIPNRFELILLASQRAREILAGAPQSAAAREARGGSKAPLAALREIALDAVSPENLTNAIVRGAREEPEACEEAESKLSEEYADEKDQRIAMNQILFEDISIEKSAPDSE